MRRVPRDDLLLQVLSGAGLEIGQASGSLRSNSKTPRKYVSTFSVFVPNINRHRIRFVPDGQASRVSRNDEKLIRKNVTYDIHLYRANIVHALSMLFTEAGTDILGYLIYIDYCVLPLLICVDLTEKFPRYASKGIGSNEETENIGAPTSHVAISYPHGTRHHFIVLDLEKGDNALWLKQALIGEGIPLPHMNDVGDPKDIVLGGADRLPADLLAKDLESLRLERSVNLGVGG